MLQQSLSICCLQHVLSEPEEIVTMNGQKLPLKCSVDYISFSAHTDYEQTSEFVRALKPPHLVSVFCTTQIDVNNRKQLKFTC